MGVRVELEQGHPQGRFVAKGEGFGGGTGQPGGESGLVRVHHGGAGADGGGVEEPLPELLAVFFDHGAQGLVAGHHSPKCRVERVLVESSAQAECERDVVGGGGAFDAVQHPEPALGVRQGCAFRPDDGYRR